MAKVIGESARYVSEQALRRHLHLMIAGMVGVALLGALFGYCICLNLQRDGFSAVSVLLQLLVLGAAMMLIERVVSRKICEFEKLRNAMRRGMSGEAEIAMILEGLPDSFTVINDLTTPFGNVDHVVVGPTGAYVIDTKNWRGTVTSDGKGELLLNGKPISKPVVKTLLRTVMSIQEKVRILSGCDPYIQAVLAFPMTYVAVGNSSTRHVHCVRGDRLHEYIAEWKPEKKWAPDEVGKVVRAFTAVASMDVGFERKAVAKPASASRRYSQTSRPSPIPVERVRATASTVAGGRKR